MYVSVYPMDCYLFRNLFCQGLTEGDRDVLTSCLSKVMTSQSCIIFPTYSHHVTKAESYDKIMTPPGSDSKDSCCDHFCHTLIISVKLLLQLLHLLVVSQQSLVSFQSTSGLLLLLLTNVSHQ